MKCPFGYTDHIPTWRCYVIYWADRLLERIPETWPPSFLHRFLLWVIDRLDSEIMTHV